ncbi:MAG: hypothetical protein EBX35_14975 [Planctomycetia bacterium]|nr:hypothetical protein [Planctomycetia bacterium]
MPRTRSFPMITIVPLAVAAAVCLGLAASAAPDAGAKASGSYNFYGSSAHHSFSSARGHVESYQSYLRDTHGVAMPLQGLADRSNDGDL